MPIHINGEPHDLETPVPLPVLLERLGLNKGVYAVEINGSLVPASARDSHTVSPGDTIELVTLVGGG